MGLSTSYGWVNRNSLLLSSLVGLASFLVLIFIKVKVGFSYIPDISGSETSTIFPIQLLVSGEQIYSDPEKPPFRFTQYTPIYFCIVSFFFKLTDWTALDVHKVFLASRFFSFLFTIGSIVSAGYLIFILTNKKIIAVISAFYIYHIFALWFLTSSRPDSLVVLLTSLYLIAAYYALQDTPNSERWWFLAILIAVTAFFTKQSGAIHSVAIAAYFIYNKQWKMLFKITAIGILIFSIYLLILPINTVPLFFSNIVGGVSNSISWDWFYHWTMEKWLLQFVAIMAMNMIISIYHFSRRDTNPFYLFLAIACFLFFIFATMTSLKIGAGVGYYQDYLIISVVQIAVFLSDKNQINKFGGKFSGIGLSLYLVFVYLHCTFYVFMLYKNGPEQNYLSKYIEQREVTEYLCNEKKLQKNDWVLVDQGNDFSGYYIRHFLPNQTLIPFSDLVYLADKNKTYQFTAFEDLIDKGEVKYVITDHGRYPKNILNYSFANTLQFSSTVGRYDIYESRNIAKY